VIQQNPEQVQDSFNQFAGTLPICTGTHAELYLSFLPAKVTMISMTATSNW
jgi:hypothetical protein